MREYYPWLSYGVDENFKPLPRAQISMILWSSDWVEPAPATPDKIKLKQGAWGFSPAGIDVWINWFPTSASGASDDLKSWDWYKDSQGEFFRLAKPDRLIDGFPVHGGWLFVTAKNKPPLFVPVSQARALNAYMAQAQRLMAQAGAGNEGLSEALATYNSAEMKAIRKEAIEQAGANEKDPKKAAEKRAKAERDDAEQERQLREGALASASSNPIYAAAKKAHDQWAQRLKGMSEAERNAPAHMRVDPDALLLEDLVAQSDPAAVALMQYNPEYVNKKLGPEIPQLLVLPIGTSQDWGRRAKRWRRCRLKSVFRLRWLNEPGGLRSSRICSDFDRVGDTKMAAIQGMGNVLCA